MTHTKKKLVRKPVRKPVVRAKTIDLTTETVVKVAGRAVKLYKVVQKGYNDQWTGSHTGFNWTPYFPTAAGPGKPYKLATTRSLVLCSYGLHVSNQPSQWGADSTPRANRRIFEVKVFGPTKGSLITDNKICAYKIQLVREVVNPTRQDPTEWARITHSSYRG